MFSAFRQFALRTVSSSSSTGRSNIGSNCVSVGLGGRLVLALQIHKYRQLILEDPTGAPDRLFRVDGAVGFDVKNQLIEVGTLFDPSALDVISHFVNGTEGGIELQPTDRPGLLLERHALAAGR